MDTGHCVRPKGLPEAFGYYWPDGVPSEYLCPPKHELYIATYQDEHGELFRVAYTYDQLRKQVVETGYWCPFMPLFVTPSILRSSNG